MRRRFFLIANPTAGVAGAPLVEEVVRALERQAARPLTRTMAADSVAARRAARMAADSGNYDAVIAAGGDGTIRHVAAALIGTRDAARHHPRRHRQRVGPRDRPCRHGRRRRAHAARRPHCHGRLRPGQCRAVPAHGRRRLRCARARRARPAPEEPRRQDGLCGTAARGADPPGGHAQRHGRRPSPHRELGRDRQRAPLRRPLRPGAARRHPGAGARGDPVQGEEPCRARSASS